MAALHGIIAEFGEEDELHQAVRAAKAAGFNKIEAFSPFPSRDIAADLSLPVTAVPWIALGAGLVGGAIQYAVQYGTNVVDYPLNVGGRPLHSWPAFVPAMLLVAILWASVAAILGMLLLTRLPRLHHPVFAVPGFERASEDRFFLMILGADPQFDRQATASFLLSLRPLAVREVPE